MTDPDGADRAPGGLGSASRRGFLLTAGTGTAVGLSSASAGARGGAGRTGALSVAATGALCPTLRRAARRFRRERSDARVSVASADASDGLRRFAAGDVDVLAAGRPLLPAEAERVRAAGVEYAGGEFAVEVAALLHPAPVWYEPMATERLVERWTDAPNAETWAEVAPEGPDAAELQRAARDGELAAGRPSSGGVHLVRGIRAHQYALGYGGVGYYEPDAAHVASIAEADGTVAATPLVRLAFVYVDCGSLRRGEVEAFEGALSDAAVGVPRVADDDTFAPDGRRLVDPSA